MSPSPPQAPQNEETSGAASAAAPVRSRRTVLWIFTSYFGEGLPWSFLHQMATEFLTSIGASKTQISSTSLLHTAVFFKFAWSPVVDLFGRKRTWQILLQLLLGLGMFGVAAVSSSRNLTLFWAAVGALAIVHATHDIACDGFYIQALDSKRRALFSGVRTAPFRAAMFVGSSLLVFLAGQTSWFWGFGAAGALMILVAVLNAAVLPHPPEQSAEETVAPSHRKTADFWAAYGSFLLQPKAGVVLTFMFFYKIGDIMMFAMSKPLLNDIGIDTTHRAILNGIGTTTVIVASITGGAIIARFGLARCLVPMTFFQNLAIPLYIGMAIVRPSFAGVIPIVILEQFAAGIGAAAHVVFLMERCRARFSASHYAFATALVALGSTLSGFLSGPINEAVGHPVFFTIAFVASWPSLVLVFFVPKSPIDATV